MRAAFYNKFTSCRERLSIIISFHGSRCIFYMGHSYPYVLYDNPYNSYDKRSATYQCYHFSSGGHGIHCIFLPGRPLPIHFCRPYRYGGIRCRLF